MTLAIEAVLERTRGLEALLKTNYGATGKGLHELADSVQDLLPLDILGKIRFIATVRNRLVHEQGFEFAGDEARFWRACDEVAAVLSLGSQPLVVPAPPRSEARPASATGQPPPFEPARRRRQALQQLPSSSSYRSLFVWIGAAALLVGLVACALVLPFLVSSRSAPVSATPTSTRFVQVAPLSPASGLRSISPLTAPADVCLIEWREYDGAFLGDMNLEMVWDSMVSERVSDSEITREQFYALMMGQNPSLVEDGLLFKDGKKYLLPNCRGPR